MADRISLEELKERLKAKNIYELRQVARGVGVQSPTAGKKDRLLKEILDIATGKSDPAPHTTKGAPPKSEEYDRLLVAEILKCREKHLTPYSEGFNEEKKIYMTVSSNESIDLLYCNAAGLLEKSGGKWFIRVNGCRNDCLNDVFVSQSFITNNDLREGDFLEGEGRRESSDEIFGLAKLNSVNGRPLAESSNRRKFESLTPVYPDRRYRLERGQNDIDGRIIDLISPVGAGQRALVVTNKSRLKIKFLKEIAKGIEVNYPEAKLIFVLIDVGAEEAADYQREFPMSDIFASPMDMGASCHLRTAKLALEYAKRSTEYSNDVVLVLDDVNRIVRAFNSCGRNNPDMSETAVDGVKKYFSAARNAEEGGSLTIISALNYETCFTENAAFSELGDMCNMKIVLSSSVRSRSSSCIDILSSGADAEERLLTYEELDAADVLRDIAKESGAEECVKKFVNTASNAQLCSEINKTE